VPAVFSILTGARRWGLASLLLIALSLSACGGGNDDSAGEEGITAKEAVAAFEEAAGGHEFEKAISLTDGAVAYGPKSSPDPEDVEQLNEALGESSVLWQVLVFDGADPPLDKEAVEAAAFASDKLKDEGEGVYLGDNDIAYMANGNVVVTGPVLDGNVDDVTLEGWQAVLDEL
jgi:hypothetical protein